MRAVADAGPLIHLSWIDRLGLLPQLFDEVIVPMAVRNEVLRVGPDFLGATSLRAAFSARTVVVQPVRDPTKVEALRARLDPGEAEAIVLMRELRTDMILADDRRARRQATQEGFALMGTVGILRVARDRGLIPAVLPLLARLRRRGFRISAELEERIRREEV